MADSSLELQMSLKDNKVATGLDALARKEDDVAKQAKKIADEAKKADAELQRFAKRTKEIDSTPIERYGKQMDRLAEAHRKGKLTEEEYARAVARTKKELAAAVEATDTYAERMQSVAAAEGAAAKESARTAGWLARVKLNSAEMEHAEAIRMIQEKAAAEKAAAEQIASRTRWLAGVKSTSAQQEQTDNLRALQAKKAQEKEVAAAAAQSAKDRMAWQQRVRSNSARLEQEQKLADLQAMKRQNELFGEGALGQLTALAGGYFTLQAAVNLVGDAFAYAREESEDALGSLRSLDDARRELNQVSSSQGEYAARMNRADAAAATYGVHRKEAYATLTQAINYGIEGDYEQIMAGSQVVKPGAAIEVGGRLSSMFGGGISTTQATSMGLAAGRKSNMTFEQFASTMAIIGEGGMRQGAGAEESMAAVAALSSDFASGKVTADRIKTFLAKASMHDATRGKGLLGALDVAKGMSREELQGTGGLLGKDQEANAAFEMLVKDEARVRAFMAEIAAQRQNPTELAMGIARAQGTSQDVAARLDAAGITRAELDRENQLGVGEGARSAAANQQAALANRLGLGGWRRWAASAARGVATFFGGNADMVTGAGITGEFASRQPAAFMPMQNPIGAGMAWGQELPRLLTGQNEFAKQSLAELREIKDALKRTAPKTAKPLK